MQPFYKARTNSLPEPHLLLMVYIDSQMQTIYNSETCIQRHTWRLSIALQKHTKGENFLVHYFKRHRLFLKDGFEAGV